MSNIQSQVAGRYDLVLDQNAANTVELYLYADEARTQSLDLTGYTADSQVRNSRTGGVLATFTATIPAPATAGLVRLELDYATSVALSWAGKAYYDVRILDSNGVPTRVVEGSCQLSKGTTFGPTGPIGS